MSDEARRPDWTPEGAGPEFASNVVKGVERDHDGRPGTANTAQPGHRPQARRRLAVEDYVQGVLAKDRAMLARAITLIESNAPAHMDAAQEVVTALLPHAGESIRVGITGVPGVGKSTFIEAMGTWLCDRDRKVAVLAVDPSSSIHGGSILGDKTRMELLSRHPNAFIRPSPAAGNLGGVTRKSRETIVLCEAFGFETIVVETVGVGQSETAVRAMVDFFLVLLLGGAGDELQGMKKGIIELADGLAINKADGSNKAAAETARAEYARAIHYMGPTPTGWKPAVLTCSAVSGEGIPEVWGMIEKFREQLTLSGAFRQRRREQRVNWMMEMISQHLEDSFHRNAAVREALATVRQDVLDGRLTTSVGARDLLRRFYESARLEDLLAGL